MSPLITFLPRSKLKIKRSVTKPLDIKEDQFEETVYSAFNGVSKMSSASKRLLLDSAVMVDIGISKLLFSVTAREQSLLQSKVPVIYKKHVYSKQTLSFALWYCATMLLKIFMKECLSEFDSST